MIFHFVIQGFHWYSLKQRLITLGKINEIFKSNVNNYLKNTLFAPKGHLAV